jgi:PEGA domain-containing protein
MRKTCQCTLLVILIGLGAHCLRAQAATEAAILNSNSAAASQNAKPPTFPSISAAADGPSSSTSSPHLVAHSGPPPDEVNRKDFEDNAGDRAGKLLLRSVPTGAEVFINDLLVGRTPMLMVIAPGKYKVEMRGPRQESGHSSVGVLPKETQTVLINLSQRYPTTVSVR